MTEPRKANTRVRQMWSTDEQSPRKPASIDLHVAKALKRRRRELGITQQDLADQLGLTFQQIQKYEGGGNRISAGRLFEIAEFLAVDVGYFFIGLEFHFKKRNEREDQHSETKREDYQEAKEFIAEVENSDPAIRDALIAVLAVLRRLQEQGYKT